MRKKKICFIAQFPPPIHGLSKAVETLYRSELNGIYDFEKIDITNNKKIFFNLIKILTSRADLYYFTISQTKGGNLRDLVIFKLLNLQRKKCLIHLHGGYYRKMIDNDLPIWQKKANYSAVSKVQGGIVLSDSLRSIFEDMLAEKNIYVVMNCIDTEFLPSDEELNKKLSQSADVLHILYLSNFIRTKGYPIVLEMAKIERHRISTGKKQRYHFDFAGKFFAEEEQVFFENYIRENHLEDIVTYHGIVSGKEKNALLDSCRIFALPTRYPNEGQPISILEAMGNGMYILTTDHAGIPDIVTNRINGIVAKEDSTSAYFYIRILDEITAEEFRRIGLENAKKCREKFTEQQYVDGMNHIFKEVLMK